MAEINFRREFRARCDGSDETNLLLEAISLCQAKNADLIIEGPGRLGYSNNIVLSGITLRVFGQLFFNALNPAASAFRLTGSNVGLFGGGIINSASVQRTPNPNATGVHIVAANNFIVDAFSVDGVASAGFFVEKSSNGRIRNTTAIRTMADGHHITGGSSNIVVENCASISTGDDGFAVVSYKKDGNKCRNIRFYRVTVNNSAARGCAVLGGDDIEFNGFSVDGAANAGVYIFGEQPYDTFSPYNVTVRDGTIINTDKRLMSHQGAVLVGDTNGVRPDKILLQNISIGRSSGLSVAALKILSGSRILLRSIDIRDTSSCAIILNAHDVQMENIKSQNSAGCFVQLGPNASGKIIMRNLISKNAFQTGGNSGYLVNIPQNTAAKSEMYLDSLQNAGPEGRGVIDPMVAKRLKHVDNIYSNYKKITFN